MSDSAQVVEAYAQTQLIVIKPDGKAVSVINAGPPGPRGFKGDAGSGEGSSSVFVESPGPITTWNISHEFEHDPSVEIRDTTGRICIAAVSFSPGVVHVDISPANISLSAKLTP